MLANGCLTALAGDDPFRFATHFEQGWPPTPLMQAIASSGVSYIRTTFTLSVGKPIPAVMCALHGIYVGLMRMRLANYTVDGIPCTKKRESYDSSGEQSSARQFRRQGCASACASRLCRVRRRGWKSLSEGKRSAPNLWVLAFSRVRIHRRPVHDLFYKSLNTIDSRKWNSVISNILLSWQKS